MWKYADWSPKVKKIVSGGFAAYILFILAVGTSGTTPSTPTASIAETTETPDTSQPAAQEQPQETQPESTPVATTPPSVLDQLWDSRKNRDGIDIKYNEQTKIAELIVTKKSNTYWDEKSVIQDGYTIFVGWGRSVANIAGPETISITLKTDFKDEYGKTSVSNAVDITMQVEDFKKFDWDSLVGTAIAPQLQSPSTNTLGYLIVHPALRSKLSEAKLYL